MPAGGENQQPPSVALHLAATGDQGFGRRLRLAFPLLKQVGPAALQLHGSVVLGLCWLVLPASYMALCLISLYRMRITSTTAEVLMHSNSQQ